jgi:hypothetical protein
VPATGVSSFPAALLFSATAMIKQPLAEVFSFPSLLLFCGLLGDNKVGRIKDEARNPDSSNGGNGGSFWFGSARSGRGIQIADYAMRGRPRTARVLLLSWGSLWLH